ncbi:hypothetical protein SDC9_133543 [bioreactor metagenome]|uniref:Uncharacterized protein n=1 Tax=bioreactor metagenome TaxID=1076179 RepID=A0A645DAT6_9ZZZZ
MAEQFIGLENHRCFPGNFPALMRTDTAEVIAKVAEFIHACIRPFQEIQTTQEGGFAGAARADNADNFAFIDGQTYVFQYFILTETLFQSTYLRLDHLHLLLLFLFSK